MDNLKLDKMSHDDLLYFRDSHMNLIHKWQRMIQDIDDELHKRRNDNKKSKPLTTEELMEGGWWCVDITAECAEAFKSKSIEVNNSDAWIVSRPWTICMFSSGLVTRAIGFEGGCKQIHRIGNEFYWSEKLK